MESCAIMEIPVMEGTVTAWEKSISGTFDPQIRLNNRDITAIIGICQIRRAQIPQPTILIQFHSTFGIFCSGYFQSFASVTFYRATLVQIDSPPATFIRQIVQ